MNTAATWNPVNSAGAHGTATEYQHSSGARLVRQAKGRWALLVGPVAHVLPKKASFDHAERLLAQLAH